VSTAQLRREISHLRERRPSRRPAIPEDRLEFAAAAGLPDLDPWQERLLRSNSPRVLLNCARQSGKSTMAAIIAMHQALWRPSSLVLILAPAERQAKELFTKVAAAYQALGHIIPADSYRKMGMELSIGSRIEALPGSERTIRGFSGVDLLILDEASRVADELYYATRPMLAVSGGRLLMMSTPYGKRGVFYEEWHSRVSEWERYEVPADECPRITEAFLEEERAALPSWVYRQEYECSFEETEDQVFTTDMVDASVSADVEPLFGDVA
jgi:hypothetical protein